MGCGNSKLVHDGSSERMPSKLAPLLRNQLENMRRRHRVADAMTLKESTLSTKELLKDAAVPDSSEDASSKPDREYEEDDRNSLCSPPAARPLEEKKGGREAQPEEIRMKNKVDDGGGGAEERQGQREERVIAAVTAAIEQVSREEENEEAKKGNHSNVEDEGEDDNDDGEMRVLSKSLLHGDDICPGSPSFRVYCTAPISMDTDEGRDVDDAPKTTSKSDDSGDILESINSNEDQESVTNDNNKSSARKGKLAKRLRKVFGRKGSGAMKSLLNVKSCYHPSCSGNEQTRLLSEKAAAS